MTLKFIFAVWNLSNCHTLGNVTRIINDTLIHLLQVLSNVIFFVQLCSSWQDFNWHSASRGSSAIAQLLVIAICNLGNWFAWGKRLYRGIWLVIWDSAAADATRANKNIIASQLLPALRCLSSALLLQPASNTRRCHTFTERVPRNLNWMWLR